jgi:predicted ABC-type ATPase
MSNLQPHLSIIAGPNGSGKSTCGPALLQNHFNISEFVNADTIATGLSAFNPEEVAIEASRIMLKRLKTLASQKRDFAFETTLSSRTFAQWIKKEKAKGYHFTLLYFWLFNPDLAVERVAERVRLGGHAVPEETVRRRYVKSIKNFFNLYQPLADNWVIFDNSEDNNPIKIAEGNLLTNITVHQNHQWKLFNGYNNE